jgi:diguanylate cyclase (GGDEF)-like protein
VKFRAASTGPPGGGRGLGGEGRAASTWVILNAQGGIHALTPQAADWLGISLEDGSANLFELMRGDQQAERRDEFRRFAERPGAGEHFDTYRIARTGRTLRAHLTRHAGQAQIHAVLRLAPDRNPSGNLNAGSTPPQDLTALARIAPLCSQPLPLEDILGHVLNELGPSADVDWARLAWCGDPVRYVGVVRGERCLTRPAAAAEVRLPPHRSLAAWVGSQGTPLYVDDIKGGHGYTPEFVGAGVRSAAYLPLEVAGKAAVVVLERLHAARAWTADTQALLNTVRGLLQSGLDARQQLTALERDADTDPLTGLDNRRSYQRQLNRTLDSDAAVKVVILDLDGLKLINDQHGHVRGDALLRTFAASLQHAFAPHTQVFRFGGDEFALLNVGATLRDHLLLRQLEWVLRSLQEAGFPDVSLSYGAAQSGPGLAAEDLTRLADSQMYRHKQVGRSVSRTAS